MANPLWTTDDGAVQKPGFFPSSHAGDYQGSMISAVYLIRDDGFALLQLRDQKVGLRHAGLWVPPGGHLDTGETFHEAALREFLEETAVRCGTLNWIGAVEMVSPPWSPCLLGNFWSRYDGVQTYECREGQDLKFISRHQAKGLPMPSFVIRTWDLVLSIT